MSKPPFYQLETDLLPDDLFQEDVPVEKWLDRCLSTNNPAGFESLNRVHPIELDVELERVVGISLYLFLNVFPFLLLPLALLYGLGPVWAPCLVRGLLGYATILFVLEYFVFQRHFLRKYRQAGYLEADEDDFRRNQYVFTERNNCKYFSTRFVWPQSLHYPGALANTPALFCVVPHGVAPFGVFAYPFWSKLFNDKLCRWTTAPIVLKLPFVGYLVRKIGYIPAKAHDILIALQKDQNVGVILDGIAGMFHQSATEETAYLKQRKGIVKIALKAGVPIVPVYAFGHTAAYTLLVDPFGILEKLSNSLQTALCPFLGRWGWPLGPPRRVPVTLCLGEPVQCPKTASPTQQQIDDHHAKLLQGYQQVFDLHKTAYGWKDKKLHFV